MSDMRSTVRVSLESGLERELEPGDLIGRAANCALRIDDTRISEAHAMITRRREGLVLLALRGRVAVDGKPRTRVALAPGVRVVLAGSHPLTVVALECPPVRPAIVRGPGAPDGSAPSSDHTTLLGRVITLYADPDAAPTTWFDPDGDARVLGGKRGPRLRVPGAPDRPLHEGDELRLGASRFRFVHLQRAAPEPAATNDRGHLDVTLRIVVRFDTVLITTGAGRSVTLDGISARMLSELAEVKAPIAWTELARHLWNTPADSATRHRWDQLMLRVRQKLREAGVRSDLIRANRNGLVELVLGPDDKLQVRT